MSGSHFEESRAAITGHFADNFISAPGVPWAPVQYDNRPFTAPATGIWSRFTIVEGQRDNAAVGTDFQRSMGLVYLQIFCREGEGTAAAYQAGDKFADIFDNADLGQLWGQILFRTASTQRVGKTQEGWMQFNAVVAFQTDAGPDGDEMPVEGEAAPGTSRIRLAIGSAPEDFAQLPDGRVWLFVLPDGKVATIDKNGNVVQAGGGGEAFDYYTHNQDAPAETWTIAHNLGRKPIISLFTTGGARFDAEIVDLSTNVAAVYLGSAMAGTARCV